MANDNELNGAIHGRGEDSNGALILDEASEEGNGFLHSFIGLTMLRYRRILIRSSLVSMAVVFCLTCFVMHPKYEATAIIRPVGQNPNSLGGLLQSVGMSNQNFAGVGIDSDIGTNIHDPDELVAVLTSYTFTTDMIKAENLGPKLSGGRSLSGLLGMLLPFKSHHKGHDSPMWGYYLALSSAFYCENSLRTGNITLTFRNKDPEFAKYVLELYVDHLRSHLRARDVAYNTAAANSLEQAAASASDPMLRDDLYQLASMQVQKIKTAQANADFAFGVIEQPYVPPNPVSPWVLLDTLCVGVMIPLLVLAFLTVRDWTPELRKQLADAVEESNHLPHSRPVSSYPARRTVPSGTDRVFVEKESS